MARTLLRSISLPGNWFDVALVHGINGSTAGVGGAVGPVADSLPPDIVKQNSENATQKLYHKKLKNNSENSAANTTRSTIFSSHDITTKNLRLNLKNLGQNQLSSSTTDSNISLSTPCSPRDDDPFSKKLEVCKFDRIAFFNRLFDQSYRHGGDNNKVNVKLNSEINYTQDFWMSTVLARTRFVELGHASIENGKDSLVDLIDQTFDDKRCDQLCVYFARTRADFKNLIKTFQFYDFVSIPKTSLDLPLSSDNHYMIYSTNESSDSDGVDDDNSDFDLIEFD